jgi:hypothetical protein
MRSGVIGGIPRPETRSTERRRAGREVFGETIASSKRESDRPADRPNRQVWQRRLGRDLTDEDARQIMHNVTGFFGVLAEWSRADKLATANDAAAPTKPIEGGVRHES